MYASLRQSAAALDLSNGSVHSANPATKAVERKTFTNINGAELKYKSVSIFYGSNSGTCEALSNVLANDCAKAGFKVNPIRPLDSAKEDFAANELVIIITATYDGRPTDNATKFVDWLHALDGKPLSGVSYAVFGCGTFDQARREALTDLI